MTPRYLIVANPDGKRWQSYERELRAFWAERSTEPEIVVLPWRALIPEHGSLDAFADWDRPGVVRIESPGRDADVIRMLRKSGASLDPSSANVDLPYRKGELVAPRLEYLGFRSVLEGLGRSLNARPHLLRTACPRAIAELFDKRATAERLTKANLPCPPSIPTPTSADELLDAIRQAGFAPAYVKLNTGSSAVGIAVVHADAAPWAITSLVRLDGAFFSTRRLRRVDGEPLLATLNWLLAEDAVVQRGIPRTQIDGQNFDVRIVVQHGEPTFAIYRLSNQPMTNLHLGGRRGVPERCRAAIPNRAWLDAIDHCVEAAKLYPLASVGIDLVFERGYHRHWLLEVNAFGDFFPGLTGANGRSVYRVEIEGTARKAGWIG